MKEQQRNIYSSSSQSVPCALLSFVFKQMQFVFYLITIGLSMNNSRKSMDKIDFAYCIS